MPVSFNNFPTNWKLPLYWVETNSDLAGLPTAKQPALLVGQKLAAGSALSDVPVAVGTLEQAKAFFGEGSMLERMFAKYYQGSFAHEVWALPVDEPADGVVATGRIDFTHAATAAGTLYVYIAGQRVSIAVASGDTAADMATDLAAAIQAMATLPVTAAVNSGDGTVTLTAKWKGSTGNDIDVRDNYLGALGNEVMPAGVTIAYTAMSGGTGQPTFTNAIASIADDEYDYVALPFTDATSLGVWETEYGFGDSGRWGWMRQAFGSLYSAYRATYANMITWGGTQNSPVLSAMAIEVDSPSPVWEWAAAYVSKAARALSNDPARPLQTLPLDGILPARKHFRFIRSELNSIAGTGVATQAVNADGVPAILRETTTYQKNSHGLGDDAYELVTTLATLAKLIRNQRQAITSKYPRHKLADNGTRFGLGQAIVTPNIIKAELVAQYSVDQFNGLVENLAAFKKNLIVERDPNNPNRVNVVYPPDLVNQLRVFAVLAQFRLQYDRGVDTAIA